MVTMVIEPGMQDWAVWKLVFDEHAAARKEHGCISEESFRVAGEPRVTFWDTIQTREF